MIGEQTSTTSMRGRLFFLDLSNPVATLILGASITLIAYILHRKLSERALGNHQASDPWVPEDELVLLTGGSSGIGRKIMEDLVHRRVRVVMLDINPPTFDLPERASFYQADITSAKAIADLASTIRAEHGDPTVLLNNAGIFYHGSILEKPEQEIRRTFEVNTVSHFLLLKEFLPAMVRANRGHIVTVASCASFIAVGEMVDYCCSKASALAFHEGLQQELKYWYRAPNVRTRLVQLVLFLRTFLSLPHGPFVNGSLNYRYSIVHPLWVETPMIKGFTDYRAVFGQPIMNPAIVSRAIIDHLSSRKSGQIILPRSLSLAGSLRACPSWMQELIRSFVSKIVRRVSDVRSAEQVDVSS